MNGKYTFQINLIKNNLNFKEKKRKNRLFQSKNNKKKNNLKLKYSGKCK